MTTPRVIELPRRLEPISRDTFLGGQDADADGRLADVVLLRPRDGVRRAARGRSRRLHAVAAAGPGDQAA